MLELTENEKTLLLQIARATVHAYLSNGTRYEVNPSTLTENLKQNGACFVTLTKNGALRGCIGSLLAYQPLYKDVQNHALEAAIEDYRFNPVNIRELPGLVIEISILTPPAKVEYTNPQELKSKLRPGVDGVTISFGHDRATFLPQVWEELPTHEEFLGHLCRKMGYPITFWKDEHLEVEIYQVIHFQEH